MTNNNYIKLNMMNFKELAENILTDLMNNGSLSDILLKTKIFATKRSDNELLLWISKELDGYGDEKLPKYRNLRCGLKVEVVVPFGGYGIVDFPIDMIEDDNARLDEALKKFSGDFGGSADAMAVAEELRQGAEMVKDVDTW